MTSCDYNKNLFQSLAGISKELVSKLENRLNEWDVNKTEIGDVLLEMVSIIYYGEMS